MSTRSLCGFCVLLVVMATGLCHQMNRVSANPANPETPQLVRGAETADEAAVALIRAYANQDYELFLRTRALFECEPEVGGGPNRYAEALHRTRFTNQDVDHNVYDLRTRLNGATARTTRKQAPKLDFIDAAAIGDTVHHQRLLFVDVAIDDHEQLGYRSRVAVIESANRWYAVPRCNVSRRIYELADTVSASE